MNLGPTASGRKEAKNAIADEAGRSVSIALR